MAFTAILLGVSLLPAIAGGAGAAYGVGAAAAGLAFLYVAGRTAVLRTRGEAQRLLLGSVVYLPVLLLMMVLAK